MILVKRRRQFEAASFLVIICRPIREQVHLFQVLLWGGPLASLLERTQVFVYPSSPEHVRQVVSNLHQPLLSRSTLIEYLPSCKIRLVFPPFWRIKTKVEAQVKI